MSVGVQEQLVGKVIRCAVAQNTADLIIDRRVGAVIFAGGTGNPYFNTHTAPALRAAEIGADAIFKGTQVDGIYSADPNKDPNATRFEKMTHAEVIDKGLSVMDVAAVAIARENRVPISVFSIHEAGMFGEILTGGGRSTLVHEE